VIGVADENLADYWDEASRKYPTQVVWCGSPIVDSYARIWAHK
jgi:hypothetical protein